MSTQQIHTESSILQSYLLHPSPLPTLLPYQTFLTTCVPAIHRSHPSAKRLYRDLQFQRTIDVDQVRQNIERECSKSGALQAKLRHAISKETSGKDAEENSKPNTKKRKRNQTLSDHNNSNGDNINRNNDEDNIIQSDPQSEDELFHPTPTHDPFSLDGSNSLHTPSSLLSTLNTTISALQYELTTLESATTTTLSEITETIGQLSDLRYGRFARPSGAIGDESLEGDIEVLIRGLIGVIRREGMRGDETAGDEDEDGTEDGN